MRDHYYDRKKKDTVVCLAGAQSLLRPEKKDTVVCLVGARSLLQPEKKDTFVCLLGARFWQLRPEKKDTVVCLAGYAVVSVFGSGGKLAFFLLWREIFITTGKKKIQSSVWWVRNHYNNRKKKIQSSVWRVRDHYYDRKKKRYSRLSVGCAVLAITTRKKKDTVVCLASCAVVLCQFLVLAGNWQFFCCGGKFLL